MSLPPTYPSPRTPIGAFLREHGYEEFAALCEESPERGDPPTVTRWMEQAAPVLARLRATSGRLAGQVEQVARAYLLARRLLLLTRGHEETPEESTKFPATEPAALDNQAFPFVQPGPGGPGRTS